MDKVVGEASPWEVPSGTLDYVIKSTLPSHTFRCGPGHFSRPRSPLLSVSATGPLGAGLFYWTKSPDPFLRS